jgi:hypothetical protein
MQYYLLDFPFLAILDQKEKHRYRNYRELTYDGRADTMPKLPYLTQETPYQTRHDPAAARGFGWFGPTPWALRVTPTKHQRGTARRGNTETRERGNVSGDYWLGRATSFNRWLAVVAYTCLRLVENLTLGISRYGANHAARGKDSVTLSS